MFKIMAFLTRREDVETQAFIEYYETHHVPLIRSLAPTPIGYRRSYLVRGDELNIEGDEIGFDVVTELVFPDRPAYLAWIDRLGVEEIGADEERVPARPRPRAYVVDERGWPSARP